MPTGRTKSYTYTPDIIDDIHYKAAIGRPRIRGYGALGTPMALADLTFLPANLSRLVIDSYREPCYTDVKLGRRFAKRPLEISIPIMVAGMGYGSISRPVRMAIAKATAAVETAYGTGEGGIIPGEREIAHKIIYQIGPGHLGVNIDDLKKADAIELLLDTANHGIGRYLYAEKLVPEVAQVWGVPPEIDFFAPATHMDFDDPESLALKIEELREATDWEIPIGIKVGGRMDEMIRIALACDIDLIMIDGIQAGTPGGPDALVENVGLPTIAALTQAISGLGGVGKTQLAVEYAYRHAGDYAAVWWVRAEEPGPLAADYAALAGALGRAGLEEPAGGVTVACLKRMVASGHIRPEEETVVFITGAGLKTIESVVDRLPEPIRVPADAGAFDGAMAARAARLAGATVGGA